MKCPHCMKEYGDESDFAGFSLDDDEMKAKDDVLAELMEVMEQPLEHKLRSKKPSAMSIEIVSAKPKKDEEDEDELL